ncbi:MAG: BBE domain-containing protein [Firmicutes bacterium]|nr:BBE domain-containing protein [Bacillota bacterium]
MAWEAGWADPGVAAAGQQWVRRNRHALQAEAYHDGTYLNVMDTTGDNAAVVARSYGAQYPRLQALKHQYDPTNRFRFNANILPA